MTFKWKKDPNFMVYDPERNLEVVNAGGNIELSKIIIKKIDSDEVIGGIQYSFSERLIEYDCEADKVSKDSHMFVLDFRGFIRSPIREAYIGDYSMQESKNIVREILKSIAEYLIRNRKRINSAKLSWFRKDEEFLIGGNEDGATINK